MTEKHSYVWSFKQETSAVETICQLWVIYCIQHTEFLQPEPQLAV